VAGKSEMLRARPERWSRRREDSRQGRLENGRQLARGQGKVEGRAEVERLERQRG